MESLTSALESLLGPLIFQVPLQVVESMRQGMSPKHAAEDAIQRIIRHYPSYVGAVVAVDHKGRHSAAAHGWKFEYAARSQSHNTTVFTVEPIGLPSRHQRALQASAGFPVTAAGAH